MMTLFELDHGVATRCKGACSTFNVQRWRRKQKIKDYFKVCPAGCNRFLGVTLRHSRDIFDKALYVKPPKQRSVENKP
jgi:hypothetical protein